MNGQWVTQAASSTTSKSTMQACLMQKNVKNILPAKLKELSNHAIFSPCCQDGSTGKNRQESILQSV